ncbi:MAG: AraC family chitin signaling transcriptional activator, partial [Candidatus Latescibacterota bacterium]
MNNKTSGIVAYFFFLFMLFALHGVNGQELPPIVNYSSTVYAGGSQNWAISQEENKFIYIANNDGLLEFNGANWTLYPSPNKAIIRSTLAIEGKVYSGSYMDFGYWQRNEFGTLKYSSLSQKLGLDLKEDEQFWNILPYNEWILFQSLNRIYIYNSVDSSIRFIESKGTLNKSFKVGNKVFFHVLNDGLYTIEKGESVLVSEDSIFKNDIVIDVLEIDNQMYIVTQSGEFYSLSGSETTKWRIPADALLQNTTIYNSEQLKNGNIAIGTISSGIFLISRQGEVIFQINQTMGLGNNTVLSLFEDYEGNIWAGLDNGIDCINVTAPFLNYVDQEGRLGTTYASVLHQGNLY